MKFVKGAKWGAWILPAIAMGFLAGTAPQPVRAQQAVGGVDDSGGIPSQTGEITALLKGVKFDQQLGSQIPLDDTFRDENGRTVELKSYFGKKPVVLILAYYTCPVLCSEVMSGSAQAFKKLDFKLGDQYTALTVSFDPKDTPEVAARTKKTYVDLYGKADAVAGWHFLTGQKAQIDRLANAVGFHYAYDPQNGQYLHAAGIVVITPAGKVAQYFYGISFPERDLRLALVQSSQEEIGSVMDQILLFCCSYDPGTGRYVATITRILKIGAGLTIILIAGGFFFLYRWNFKGRGTRAA